MRAVACDAGLRIMRDRGLRRVGALCARMRDTSPLGIVVVWAGGMALGSVHWPDKETAVRQHSMGYYIIRWTIPEIISKPRRGRPRKGVAPGLPSSTLRVAMQTAIVQATDLEAARKLANEHMRTQPSLSRLQDVEEHSATPR